MFDDLMILISTAASNREGEKNLQLHINLLSGFNGFNRMMKMK